MKEIIIVGGGGFAKEIIWLASSCGRSVRGLLDDNEEAQGNTLSGIDVIGRVSDWVDFQDCEFIIAIGSPRVRALVYRKMTELGIPKFSTLVHPSVHMSKDVEIGEGSMICAGSILTTEIKLGSHCILNLNVTVGHESELSDFVTVAPMAVISGNVILEECVEIGTGATLRQGLIVSKGAMLGMGGVLTKNIPQNCIFAGNPAKKLKELPEI